jgi:hypothetical protein
MSAHPDTGRHSRHSVTADDAPDDYLDSLVEQDQPVRRVRLTPASTIRPRAVRWLWDDRIPVGEITLTPGRGGLGKSTFHAWLIARVTRGELEGHFLGEPRACVIAATEDSWDRTIVPRLIAAGADLNLVFRVDVVTDASSVVAISLPRDLGALETELIELGAVLLSVDPLLGVVDGGLDTHKDREVRQALEPLVQLGDRTGCSIVGNAHFNKSGGTDPVGLVMGSAAFANVARAALGFAVDPDAEDGSGVISQIKNNLGRLDLPSLSFRIDEALVDTDDGTASVGRFVMLGNSDRSVGDILRTGGERSEGRSEIEVAKDYLRDYLADGGHLSKEVINDAREGHGISEKTLRRAQKDIGVTAYQSGGKWWWRLGQMATCPVPPAWPSDHLNSDDNVVVNLFDDPVDPNELVDR